jgi:hypothetical protein
MRRAACRLTYQSPSITSPSVFTARATITPLAGCRSPVFFNELLICSSNSLNKRALTSATGTGVGSLRSGSSG